MVDELELLKKEWQKQDATLPKLTKKEIYPMLKKKSSSITKWIFIISVLEFIFWIAVNFLFGNREKDQAFVAETGLETFNLIVIIINYTALAFFVAVFYLNYRNIKATDTARQLMQTIFKTRRTVKYYIWFNLLLLAIGAIVAFIIVWQHNPQTFDNNTNILVPLLALIAIIAIAIGILLLFYRVIYGILLRRLKVNYEELKKMEV